MIGALYYIAPELFKKFYSTKSDIWSAGCILYFLVTGNPPFYDESQKEIINKIK